jgi:DNA-binding NarL/FixJ family response regulator
MDPIDNLKFFIVDDDAFCRSLYQQHLVNLGFRNNVLFDNGYDCLKKLDLQPDIILLDYDMKPYNGLETLKMIKQYNPHIHLFIITSRQDEQLKDDVLQCGACGFIPKGDQDLEMISRMVSNIKLLKQEVVSAG